MIANRSNSWKQPRSWQAKFVLKCKSAQEYLEHSIEVSLWRCRLFRIGFCYLNLGENGNWRVESTSTCNLWTSSHAEACAGKQDSGDFSVATQPVRTAYRARAPALLLSICSLKMLITGTSGTAGALVPDNGTTWAASLGNFTFLCLDFSRGVARRVAEQHPAVLCPLTGMGGRIRRR